MTDDDLIRRGDALAAAADLYRWSIAAGEELEASIAALEPVAAPEHVNETPKTEHDAGNALTHDPACDHCGMDPSAIREAALREAADLVDAKLARWGFPSTYDGSREEMRYAILALIPKGAADV